MNKQIIQGHATVKAFTGNHPPHLNISVDQPEFETMQLQNELDTLSVYPCYSQKYPSSILIYPISIP